MQISQQTYNDFISGRIDSFYANAYASLLMYATRTLGDDLSFLAEDCVQDAVFEAYQNRRSFDNNAKLKSYLYRCVHNRAVSFLRKSNSHSTYAFIQKQNDENICFNNSILKQETFDLLYDAIERLPEVLKIIFEMSFEQGLKNQEISDKLGISIHAVKKRKARLISSLREMLTGDTLLLLFYMFSGSC